MKNILIILTLLTFITVTKSFGQSSCDSIYHYYETSPQYKNDAERLDEFVFNTLAPQIEDCVQRDSNLIRSLNIILSIDSQGKVFDATITDKNITDICKEELKKILLSMKGWTPAIINGKAVCCTYNLKIPCLLWE